MATFIAFTDLGTDPLTAAWLAAIGLLLVLVIALPVLRTVIAAALYLIATLTRRQHLRIAAQRVMPRTMHLIGSLVLGSVAVAAPAIAAPDGQRTLATVDLDRDGGAARSARATTGSSSVAATPSTSPARVATPQRVGPPAHSEATGPEVRERDHGGRTLYLVRSGDCLWDIAEDHLSAATDAEITEAWKAIWRANRAVIGDDPGLIRPGQQLDLGALS